MIAIFPELATSAARGNVEELAVLVRKYFGGPDKFTSELDMVPIMKNFGINIAEAVMSDIGALLAKDEKGSFQITAVIANGFDDLAERNFLLAHMLGHYLFHVQPFIARGDWSISGFREDISPIIRYSQGRVDLSVNALERDKEQLADSFAAAVLLPQAMVKRAYNRLNDIEKTSKFFNIKTSCLVRRLQQLNIVNEQPVSFFDAEQKIIKPAKQSKGREGLVSQVLSNNTASRPLKTVSMPKSFAASAYTEMDKKTKTDSSKASLPDSRLVSEPREGESTLKSLKKLRAIAKKIDKSVPI